MGMIQRRTASFANMSFLDLLACTLGALLFIMIILFLQTAGYVAASAVDVPEAERLRRERDALMEENVRVQDRIAALEADLKTTTEAREQVAADAEAGEEALEEQLRRRERELAAARADAEPDRREAETETALARKREDEARRRIDAAREAASRTASKDDALVAVPDDTDDPVLRRINTFYHVVCERDHVMVNLVSPKAGAEFRDRKVAVTHLGTKGSAFAAALDDVKANSRTHTVVLWVRPDGIATSREAWKLAGEAGVTNIGDEPFDRDRPLKLPELKR